MQKILIFGRVLKFGRMDLLKFGFLEGNLVKLIVQRKSEKLQIMMVIGQS